MEKSDEEQAWITASRQGDQQAFAALVERYQRMIHDLTYRMSGSLSDAEDLAQETFIRAYRQLHAFRGDAKFSSWLYRIGINTCLNWRKSQARRSRLHDEVARQDNQPGHDSDMLDKVQAALLKLPDKQRAAIILTVYEEMSHAEAGRVLGCSETTVSWRVFMARKQLKGWLQCE
jgi:RNA polymerase sigma-70 factor (ECF subfamily)